MLVFSDAREELGWPFARQLYLLHSLNFLHKMLATGEPQALASQLQVNSSLHSRSTRQDTDLVLPRVRTEAGRRRHLYSVAQVDNDYTTKVLIAKVRRTKVRVQMFARKYT